MPIITANITGREAKNYINHFIDQYIFENYQPIVDLTDAQITSFVTNLEIFLQTNIGTPNGYTIDVSLIGLNSENVVDVEIITRQIHTINIQVSIT